MKGTVSDADGQPLIGAYVMPKDQNTGVTTDLDGKFSIVVPRGTTLVVSSIGFITQELTASPTLNIVMEEDISMIEETVVVGYGTQKKASLSSAISNIRSEELTATKQSDVLASLQGKVPGLQRVTPVTSTPTSNSAATTNRWSSSTVSSAPHRAAARRPTPPTPTPVPRSWPSSIRRTSRASPC